MCSAGGRGEVWRMAVGCCAGSGHGACGQCPLAAAYGCRAEQAHHTSSPQSTLGCVSGPPAQGSAASCGCGVHRGMALRHMGSRHRGPMGSIRQLHHVAAGRGRVCPPCPLPVQHSAAVPTPLSPPWGVTDSWGYERMWLQALGVGKGGSWWPIAAASGRVWGAWG